MTAPLLLGAASFFVFALSDLFGVLRPRRGASAFFALGGVLLTASTLWLVLRRGPGALFGALWPLRWLSLLAAAAGLALLVHTLFFALPAGGGAGLGLAFALFTALDAAYVFWQDRRVFPHSIAGYESYRARVPFLLPTARSLRACLKTGKGRG